MKDFEGREAKWLAPIPQAIVFPRIFSQHISGEFLSPVIFFSVALNSFCVCVWTKFTEQIKNSLRSYHIRTDWDSFDFGCRDVGSITNCSVGKYHAY